MARLDAARQGQCVGISASDHDSYWPRHCEVRGHYRYTLYRAFNAKYARNNVDHNCSGAKSEQNQDHRNYRRWSDTPEILVCACVVTETLLDGGM